MYDDQDRDFLNLVSLRITKNSRIVYEIYRDTMKKIRFCLLSINSPAEAFRVQTEYALFGPSFRRLRYSKVLREVEEDHSLKIQHFLNR